MNTFIFRLSLALCALALVGVAAALFLSARYMAQEQRLAVSGELETAMDRARLAARLNPFSAEPLTAQSYILQQRGENEAAADALREAIRRDPANYSTYIALGNLQSGALGESEEAARSYRKALERNPLESSVRSAYATELMKIGNLREAARQYQKIREHEAANTTDLYNLGQIYVHTEAPKRALKVLQRAEKKAQREIRVSTGSDRQQARELLTSIELAIADAYVVDEDFNAAAEVLSGSSSEQAPAILNLLSSDPYGYRQSVLRDEIF